MNKEAFIGQPIHSLQTMLRAIGASDTQYTELLSDGVFGSRTEKAVKQFQESHGLPATGIVNQETWDQIVDAYSLCRLQQEPPTPIPVTMGQCIRKGTHCPTAFLAQGMLTAFGEHFRCLNCPPISGTLDNDTENALKGFQQLCGLPCSGELDRLTWKHLCLLYPLACGEQMPVNC